MAGEDNLETAKRAYKAFSEGDGEAAMEKISDDIVWITPGNSAVSGTRRGKEEVGELWSKLLDKGFKTAPQFWFADDERVVVLTQHTVDGEQADAADVLSFNEDGELVRFQSALDTALLEKIYGTE